MSRRGENIRKRKDGRWEGRYIKGYDSKKQKARYASVYGKTYAETKQKLDEAKYKSSIGVVYVDAKNKLFGEIINSWFNAKKINLKPSSIIKYQNLIEKHILPELGHRKLRELNADLFYTFLDAQQKNGNKKNGGMLSTSSLQTMLYILNATIKYAASNNMVAYFSICLTRSGKEATPIQTLEQHEEDEGESMRVRNAVNSLIYSLLSNQPASHQKFILFDPEGRSQGFAPYLEFMRSNPAVMYNKVFTTQQQLRTQIEELSSFIDEFSQTKLADSPDIFAYNRISVERPESLKCLCLLNFPKGFDEQMLEQLYNIVKNGSIDAGCAEATGTLATLYLQGEKVPTNERLAINYIKQGADMGNSVAMGKMASVYLYGSYGVQDKSMSYKVGSMIGQGLTSIGRSKSKLEEEQNYYACIIDIFDEIVS